MQARLPEAELISGEAGEVLRLRGLRDFRYLPDASPAGPRYLDADYPVADLDRVWVGISHFGEPGLAHTFLSFEFGDGRFLVASVEARLRPGQSYNPFRGLIRQYHKLLVWGTEADIVGLRSHIRGERVLLYPLSLSQEQRRGLLGALVAETAELQQRPAFYNTLLDNCTTNLLKYQPDYRWYASLLDYRVLLPGYIDGLLLEQGWIAPGTDLAGLRVKAQVQPALTHPDAADFSRAIRQGWLQGE